MNLPFMAKYNTTKAAVVALSETLHTELARDGIKVSVVCPSFFKTNLAASLAPSAKPEFVEMTTKLVAGSSIGADVIADRVYNGIARGDFHVLTHKDAAFAWMVKRMVPHGLFARAVDAGARRRVR